MWEDLHMGFLNEHPEYAMVGTCADIFDDDGVWGEYLVPERPLNDDFLWNSPFMHPTMLFRKNAVLSGGGTGKQRKQEDAKIMIFL